MTAKLKPKIVAPTDVAAIQGYCGLVWELIDSKNSEAEKINLAVVNVDKGQEAQPHIHKATEELYYILEGEGEVNIGGTVRGVSEGYVVFIPPGCVHKIKNTGSTTLRLLAINSPPYDPADTFFP